MDNLQIASSYFPSYLLNVNDSKSIDIDSVS